jgi:hypothetical protein
MTTQQSDLLKIIPPAISQDLKKMVKKFIKILSSCIIFKWRDAFQITTYGKEFSNDDYTLLLAIHFLYQR